MRYGIVIIAYAYLIYKLVVFNSYNEVFVAFGSMSHWQILSLLFAVVLMPLNMLFEALKWQVLTSKICPLTLSHALQQVFYGQTGAFISPNRIGEYPSRVLLIDNKQLWPPMIAVGMIGSLIMVMIITCIGMVAVVAFATNKTKIPSLQSVGLYIGLIYILPLILYIIKRFVNKFRSRYIVVQNIVDAITQLDYRQLLLSAFWSLLRYSIWIVQLLLLIYTVGINISLTMVFSALPIYYLLITFTPSMPIADIPIRGSWLMIALADHTNNIAAIALVTVFMWLINTVLSMCIGSAVNKSVRISPK